MLVVCFGDGLGNQMFQYAFYRALQEKYPETNVKMDIFHIYGPKMHNGFELDRIFGIQRNECDRHQALVLAELYPWYEKKYKLINYLIRRRQRLFGSKKSYIHVEDPTSFHKEVFELNTLYSYMFNGNWLNEAYFKDIRPILVKEFQFIQPVDARNQRIMEEMKATESISIHMRRGDYLAAGNLSWLTMEYYQKAIAYMEERVKNPKYYIFSDDKEYAKQAFSQLKDYQIVDQNSGKLSYRDMQLMSQCKHNIIANSSFSFWGAYLNENNEKIVVCPHKLSMTMRNPLACEGWIRIGKS